MFTASSFTMAKTWKHHYKQSWWRWWNSNWAISVLKYDALKVLYSICQQIWKTQQWPRDWKRFIFIPIPKNCNTKEYLNYCTIALISHASQVMLKILQARLQQYMWTVNFQIFKLDSEKAEDLEIKLPTPAGLSKKQESSRKTSISFFFFNFFFLLVGG